VPDPVPPGTPPGPPDGAPRARHLAQGPFPEPTGPRAPARHRAGRPPLPVRLGRAVVSAGRVRLVTGAVVLLALAVAVVALLQATGPDRRPAGATAATGPERQLLAWARDELPPGTRLTADPALTSALRAAGAGPALVTTASAGPAPAGTTVLTVTSGTAPAGSGPLARFGSGADALAVSVPDPVQPTAEQLTRRRDLTAALLANPQTTATPAVAAQLRDARVDARLVWLLAGITAQGGLGLAELPTVPGEDADGFARVAVLDAVGGKRLADDPAALEQLRSWLAAQRAPLAPDSVEQVDGGLRVAYRYIADPDGLVERAGG
jgi:hypothetical protein